MAAKRQSMFVCQDCGQHYNKWLGRCSSCAAWGTVQEELLSDKPNATVVLPEDKQPVLLQAIDGDETLRIESGMSELDRVLGGGLVPGSLILVGGDPGIGKSTLLLQMAMILSEQLTILYVTAEESLVQVKMRASRLPADGSALYLFAHTTWGGVASAIEKIRPHILIIDSIQTIGVEEIESSFGSVAQIRALTQKLLHVSKSQQITTFVVGHVTKEGTIAGPKVMEHMVDTVLYFEGERTGSYRILRAHKNRFGSAQEIGMFDMQATGLVPVSNPSALFLAQRAVGPGAIVISSQEGSRPILLEVQALVHPNHFGGIPRRNCTGFDAQRASMLCAVLSARAGVELGGSDVFINVAGGVKISEPAADLGVCLALVSASRKKPIAPGIVAIGEVGLSGEVRSSHHLLGRLKEAAALGLHTAVIPAYEKKSVETMGDTGMQLVFVEKITDATQWLGL